MQAQSLAQWKQANSLRAVQDAYYRRNEQARIACLKRYIEETK